MIGNRPDVLSLKTDPSVPLIEVVVKGTTNPNWAQRNRVNALLARLFNIQEAPDRIFDQLFAVGEQTEVGYSDRCFGIKAAVRTHIEDMRFKLNRVLQGDKITARVIEENERDERGNAI